ncbi:unnamed protein product, partial [Pneumocystis jirovecii]
KELIRTLQSLACGKVKILLKIPKGKNINTTDLFMINQVQIKETSEENKIIHKNIQKDRAFETQATIVRIMKVKKKCNHTELVQTTINVLKQRGITSVEEVELAIEKLLEKEYIEKEGSPIVRR